MKTANRILARKAAATSRKWLECRGVEVIKQTLFGTGAVLAVRGPVPHEIAGNVTVLTETVKGLERRSWVARLGGCCIHWRDWDDEQV